MMEQMTPSQRDRLAMVDLQDRILVAGQAVADYQWRMRVSASDLEVERYRDTVEALYEHIEWLEQQLLALTARQ